MHKYELLVWVVYALFCNADPDKIIKLNYQQNILSKNIIKQ